MGNDRTARGKFNRNVELEAIALNLWHGLPARVLARKSRAGSPCHERFLTPQPSRVCHVQSAFRTVQIRRAEAIVMIAAAGEHCEDQTAEDRCLRQCSAPLRSTGALCN